MTDNTIEDDLVGFFLLGGAAEALRYLRVLLSSSICSSLRTVFNALVVGGQNRVRVIALASQNDYAIRRAGCLRYLILIMVIDEYTSPLC